jgi:mRNA degradation ribonuclease J1/J2
MKPSVLEAGDTVIYSSRQIPGNENAIARVQDMLIRRKIHLVTDQDAPVHVSGHPSRGEMIEMYGLIPAENCHSGSWNRAAFAGACGLGRFLSGLANNTS